MNEQKYSYDDYVWYYVDNDRLVSGYIVDVQQLDSVGNTTFIYNIRRFSKAGSFDSMMEDDLMLPEFCTMITEMEI